MTAQTNAGIILGIVAAAPATFNEAGFEALTFVPIGEITDISGNLGRVYNLVTHMPLATRATQKFKGSYNSGSGTINLALDRDDAGQILAEAALLSDSPYSFKLTQQDGKVLYFQAMVMGFPPNAGGVDAILTRQLTIEITADDDGNDFVEADS